MTRWSVEVHASPFCICMWDGYAATPIEAAALALARWTAKPGARAAVREAGQRRKSPVYVGFA